MCALFAHECNSFQNAYFVQLLHFKEIKFRTIFRKEGGIFPLYFPTLAPIIDLMLNRFTAYSQSKPPPVSLLQIGGIDARSVQKTPAGVLVVRRGLFFVKRQRRYAAYLQKGLDTRVSDSIISQLTAHSSQLTAHSSQLTA